MSSSSKRNKILALVVAALMVATTLVVISYDAKETDATTVRNDPFTGTVVVEPDGIHDAAGEEIPESTGITYNSELRTVVLDNATIQVGGTYDNEYSGIYVSSDFDNYCVTVFLKGTNRIIAPSTIDVEEYSSGIVGYHDGEIAIMGTDAATDSLSIEFTMNSMCPNDPSYLYGVYADYFSISDCTVDVGFDIDANDVGYSCYLRGFYVEYSMYLSDAVINIHIDKFNIGNNYHEFVGFYVYYYDFVSVRSKITITTADITDVSQNNDFTGLYLYEYGSFVIADSDFTIQFGKIDGNNSGSGYGLYYVYDSMVVNSNLNITMTEAKNNIALYSYNSDYIDRTLFRDVKSVQYAESVDGELEDFGDEVYYENCAKLVVVANGSSPTPPTPTTTDNSTVIYIATLAVVATVVLLGVQAFIRRP